MVKTQTKRSHQKALIKQTYYTKVTYDCEQVLALSNMTDIDDFIAY